MKHKVRHIHFVGVGGSGMSGIAEVLLNLGYRVSGSDLSENAATRRLAGLGAKVSASHVAANVNGADAVVVSTAVAGDNPEVIAARNRRIPIVPRALMLAELMRLKQGIAIAGTHGKTTTTSLIASVLAEGGLDPTFVIGGRLLSADAHARLGKGDFLVAEADEFDRSFLELTPVVAVITNIEADHLDTYRDLDEIVDAFTAFAGRVAFYGAVIACADDAGVARVLPRVKRRVVTYGESTEASLRARGIRPDPQGTTFEVWEGERWLLGTVRLPIPGRHNVSNALAAVAVGRELSIPFPKIAAALATFSGVVRRFETKGERGGVRVVDDYAHHPTEITATLSAARQVYPERRLVALFQPHLFSRTRDFAAEFGRSLCGS
ncbi:MAG TPA: UDP-N-acetylmuramate--L-alanine ligase, partial [Burkholderiales bacterium]|nr:UDP-N-acetylmuramate--L-alanine ligase [Burkholderiales bacterium]